MGKYLVLWEIDASRLPISRKERAAGWKALLNFIKEDFKSGRTLDWGSFVGELRGFSIIEGDELDINVSLQNFPRRRGTCRKTCRRNGKIVNKF